MAPSSMEATQ